MLRPETVLLFLLHGEVGQWLPNKSAIFTEPNYQQ